MGRELTYGNGSLYDRAMGSIDRASACVPDLTMTVLGEDVRSHDGSLTHGRPHFFKIFALVLERWGIRLSFQTVERAV